MPRRPIKKPRSGRLEARYVVPGLQRGLSILGLFEADSPNLTPSQISTRLKLSRSTVFRLLYTLESSGYLSKASGTGEFALTPKVFSLGFNFLSQLPVTQIAQPYLKALAYEAQAAAHLVVLDRFEAVHVARVTPAAPLVSNLQVGTRRAAHAVASGRVLLAHMSEDDLVYIHGLMSNIESPIAAPPSLKVFLATAGADRKRGYAYCRTVNSPDLMSCASAVLNHSGVAVAALTVIGPRKHMDVTLGEKTIAFMVGQATRALSAKLGHPS